MLDDLRNSSSFEEEDPLQTQEDEPTTTRRRRREGKEPFLGMTAPQRFVISLMVLLMTCVVGALALVLFDKIYLPFF
jgi:hypothetical protein